MEPPKLHSDASIEQILDYFKVVSWDLLLVGDGSGTKWNSGIGIGWGCISIEKLSFQRVLWYGAANNGTVNIAEAMAYMMPLLYYVGQWKTTTQPRNVHIVTDSSYVAASGPKSNLPGQELNSVWDVYRQFARHGVKLHWHWLRRDSIDLNKVVDELSRQSRVLLMQSEVPHQAETITGLDHMQANVFDGQPA